VLNLQFRTVKPECEDRLRAWFAELSTRVDEVRQTLVDEGVHHEQAYILKTPDGPVLIWAAELDDPGIASRTFAQSSHPVDIEHDRVLRECLAERIEIEPSLDVAVKSLVR